MPTESAKTNSKSTVGCSLAVREEFAQVCQWRDTPQHAAADDALIAWMREPDRSKARQLIDQIAKTKSRVEAKLR